MKKNDVYIIMEVKATQSTVKSQTFISVMLKLFALIIVETEEQLEI